MHGFIGQAEAFPQPSPAQPTKTLGPVEPVRFWTEPGLVWFTGVISEQDSPRILLARGDHQNSLPSLRHTGETKSRPGGRPSGSRAHPVG